MTPSQQQPEFKLMRCPMPGCNAALFYVAGAPTSFSIRVKCRRCTVRMRTPVYVIVQISLEPQVTPVLDLTPDNSACA
jgi:hypothetical protein